MMNTVDEANRLMYIQSRVKNPVQKPRTTPETMASCSKAIRDPLTSGGLISARYSGESILPTKSDKK